MKCWAFAAICILAPLPALAAGAPSTTALLSHMPALPQDPQGAYGQWVDVDQALQEGKDFKNFNAAIHNASMASMPSVAQEQQQAAKIAAQYGTPEGQARLASMSLAQKMMVARQMQAAMGMGQAGAAGPTSDGDRKLIDGMGAYPRIGELSQKIGAINQKRVALFVRWRQDGDSNRKAESDERAKIPVCPDEAGEPSDLLVKAVALKYDDKRIALAASYILKFAPLVQEYRATVQPEAAYADSTAAKWYRIQNPGLRSQTQPAVQGAIQHAISDIAGAAGLVEDISKEAATAVAERKSTERTYAHATGC